MTDPSAGGSQQRQPTLPDILEDEVLRALELDDADRDRTLAALLRREPEHAPAVRRWLASAGLQFGAGGKATVQADGGGAAPAGGDPGGRIGPYRLLGLLGRGGFGSVHLAEHDGMKGQFAIKLLNPGMDSRDVLKRFAAEREALLRLDHPGIARLIDAGETAGSRPYFVMEYVAGDTLLQHCRRHDLPVSARIDLFLDVLDAVAHAHQKGIIHRDLSSHNVLVDGRGRPKIIDFGVAKSIGEPLLEDAALTLKGTMMGTPEYMSPEQALGQVGAIDTRTDVYALGVQLYELLTDQLPIPGVVLRTQGIAGMAQVIASHAPPRPSHIAPKQLQQQVRGDLDWIVQKAIAKRRDDRYASAAEFAGDLRRHLQHEPVIARPPTTWYVMRKFARRHRGQVAMGLTALGLLVAALLLSLHQWREARQARADLQQMHDDLARRAAAGFRLLAGQQRLRDAEAAAARLGPAWPGRVPAMRAWLLDYGEPLRAQLHEVVQRRNELSARKASMPDQRFDDPIDEDLLQALQQMASDLQRFTGGTGTVGKVERRLRWAESVVAPALQRDAGEWTRVAAAVRREHGFQLAPQPGLVPLGENPASGLFEFLDLASHPGESPWPERDPTSGRLLRQPDCGLVFALVPAGTHHLGALRGDDGLVRNDEMAADDELNGSKVQLMEFLIATTELTRGQWSTLTGAPTPEEPALPMTGVHWLEALDALRPFGMTLPTEAQWEYACRAGTKTPWWPGSGLEQAGTAGNFTGALMPVAQLRPNPFGLYDVHGNAAEWCLDWKTDYSRTTLRSGDGLQQLPPPIRPPDMRAVRGGSAIGGPRAARSSARGGRPPLTRDALLGLRPVRALVR